MIYRGQFADYNNKLYTLDFETPNESGDTVWTKVDESLFNGSHEGWTAHIFDNPDKDAGFDGWNWSWWNNFLKCRRIPNGEIGFRMNVSYMESFEVGDEIEISFRAKTEIGWIMSGEYMYGIKFIRTNTANIEVDSIKIDKVGEADYTYSMTITDSDFYLKFVFDNPNSAVFYFKNVKITNKTKGVEFNIFDTEHLNWHLSDLYDESHKSFGDLIENIPQQYIDQDGTNISCSRYVDIDVYGDIFGGGTYYKTWVYHNWDNNYGIDVNRNFRYGNVTISKNIYLKAGYYKFTCGYKSASGGKVYLYLRKEGKTIGRYEFPSTEDTFTPLDFTFYISIDEDCDEVVFGNDEETRLAYSVGLDDLVIYRSDDYQEIKEIKLGGTPFTSELEGDTDDLFKPIRSTTATASIVSDKYLFDLYSNQNDIHVSLYDDESKKWIGIVKPLIFNMGYNQEVEDIEIECIDYITVLESIYLSDYNIIKNRPIMTFGEIFGNILFKNTRYKNIYFPDIFDIDMLDVYSISTVNFIDKECKIVDNNILFVEKNWSLKKILEEMCKYMGLTLTIDGENLILIPYLQLQYNITYSIYEIGEVLYKKETNVSYNDRHNISTIYTNSDLELSPVMNKFTVKTKTNKVSDILPDFLNDDNLENITFADGFADYFTSQKLDRVEIEDKQYDSNVKLFKCKLDQVHNYEYFQSPKPQSQSELNSANITKIEKYPATYGELMDSYCGGIMDFKTKEYKEKGESIFGSTSQDRYERYLVISKGLDKNLQVLSSYPIFKIESDVMHFTNKMALCISGNMIQTPYRRGKKRSDEITDVYTKQPIERDDLHFKLQAYPPDSTEAYEFTNLFAYLNMQIKIGDYYFHNIGAGYNSGYLHRINQFYRQGWWNKNYTGGWVTGSRLQFDNEEKVHPFGKQMSITDNSGDEAINQDTSGYWILFSADESQGYAREDQIIKPEEHIKLPEHFTGKLEITFYPCSSQTINDDDRYFGAMTQFLSDFQVKLVIPRDMSMSEDEWNSETEISAIVDAESLKKADEIECEIHTDFGKCPAYSVVVGARNYMNKFISEEGEHCAEEWIVYNYTKQYSEIRKILNTSVKEVIKPNSIITLKDRNHFEKMMVDSMKVDYKTCMTDVKLVEIAD